MKVLELFAGLGACSMALKRVGIEVEIVDAVEIDKYAISSFNTIHGTNFESQDICTWDKDVEVDLIMHGSPCQDFSIAGKQSGGDIDSGTRSSLMYETIRIVGKLRPKYVIWENVKNLLSAKHKHNFDVYLETMKALGYVNYYQVLNAKDYGIPQNRERVFTVSVRKDIDKGFEFPEKRPLELRLKDFLEDKVAPQYYILDGKLNSVVSENQAGYLSGGKWDRIHESARRYYRTDGISPTIHTCQGGNIQPKVQEIGGNVRKFTPKECWRLMGFDDKDFDKVAKATSNTQLYKQAGNSIVVNVLEEIFKKLF